VIRITQTEKMYICNEKITGSGNAPVYRLVGGLFMSQFDDDIYATIVMIAIIILVLFLL
jgi:hypothetical protein